MNEKLLRETFLFGNIGNVYNTRDIKKIDLRMLEFSDKIEYNINDIWRYFHNFRTLFKDRQVDILNDEEKYIILINLFRDYVSAVERVYSIKDKFITLEPKEAQDYFKITVYIIISELQMNIRPLNVKKLTELIGVHFSSYLPFIRNHTILVYNSQPPPNNKLWKPEWKFVYENKEIILPSVDLHIDSYFKNHNFQYSFSMRDDIILIKERIEYLSKNAPLYLTGTINPNLEDLSRNIFERFPYALIYRDYPKLLNISKHVYQPPLYKLTEIMEGYGWILSIIPIDVAAYLLGYPVVTCDVPSEKNIKERVNKLNSDGIMEYLNDVKANNVILLKCFNFGINVANGIDSKGDYEDVLGELVIDYNFDDIFIHYDEGVVYYFTVSEFGEIKKKRMNPYNRSRIDNIHKIENNNFFKSKRCEKIKRRGVKVNLNGTMSMNLEEMYEGIINGSIIETNIEPKYSHDVHERSFFRAIMERHD